MFSTSFKAKGTLRWAAPELLPGHLNDHMAGDDVNIPRAPPTLQSDIYTALRHQKCAAYAAQLRPTSTYALHGTGADHQLRIAKTSTPARSMP
ncbi:hypothetical protein PAXINDRAFT_169979 [Paxillus involutus ATCC 200175]|jgi:hypothetical protein|uniref:Uncharacterized protein n=1 Tax=Paxillus involutus ATCC 200175 TaxID=664439 RepID=A0A0C9U453_PAXIN|nr:hypothetical protein PAXINDRAFT_169979 [Paxillus involutus ATCC 200175]